jgi:hypothetical protein
MAMRIGRVTGATRRDARRDRCSRPPARPFGSRMRGSCLAPLGSTSALRASAQDDEDCDYRERGTNASV